LGRVIDEKIAAEVPAKVVVEGANGPCTLAMMARHKCSMRTAAFALAVERVKAATDLPGLG
jgi:glutamate dehydrogenase/leucine dehydrogenase